MILLANLMSGVAAVLDMLLMILMFLMLGRVIISWVSADPYNPIVRFINMATEPLISVVRRYMPRIPGPLDWSVFIVFILIVFIRSFLVASLFDYARVLKGMG